MVLQLNFQPDTEASSEGCGLQSEVSVFWSVLCTSVSAAPRGPSEMATEDA